MILLWGAVDDPPMARVVQALEQRDQTFILIPPEALDNLRFEFRYGASVSGWLDLGEGRRNVETITGMYLRPVEPAPGRASHAARALLALAERLATTVLNRPSRGRSNRSKPYQSTLIANAGFAVPETLVTSDIKAARQFLACHGKVVYKSISATRSIVNTLTRDDVDRLSHLGHGPVQFQVYVPGVDVRVHVVGERFFACSVESEATDYRYANGEARLRVCELDPAIADGCVTLCRALGLSLAGIDLRLGPDGSWTCFEVNPSPGFPWFERETGHDIASAIADALARPSDLRPT